MSDNNNINENVNNNSYQKFLESYKQDEKYSYNNFEIDRSKQIGSGAFSHVYLCKNKIDKLNYAVKIMPKDNIKEQGVSIDVIYNEINIQERVIHPKIVRMYGHYEDEKDIYCFLEYVKGNTLFNKLKDGLSEKDACCYFSQAVTAIKFLHNNNVIHRDIKLENFILEDKTKNLKLCDFGWACILTNEQPMRLTVCGTYDYMSPEMMDETPYDFSVDVWSLGILLYELLHGFPAFNKNDEDYSAIYNNIMKWNFKIYKDISNNCRDLISKIIVKDPNQRLTIDDVYNHKWFKDWDNCIYSSNNNNAKNNANNNQIAVGMEGLGNISVNNASSDDMFFDVLNNVEKKNMGKKKKKKDDGKKQAVYKKSKKNKLSTVENPKENENNLENNNINNKENEVPKINENDLYKKREINVNNNEMNTINAIKRVNNNDNNLIQKTKKSEKNNNKSINISTNNIETNKKVKENKKPPSNITLKKAKEEEDNNFDLINNEDNIICTSSKDTKNIPKKKEKILYKSNVNFKNNEPYVKNEYDFNNYNNINIKDHHNKLKQEHYFENNADDNEQEYNILMYKSKNSILNNNNNSISNNNRNNSNNDYLYNYDLNDDVFMANDNLQHTLDIFDQAEQLKKENLIEQKKIEKKEESFWDKLFKNFKCQ